MGTVDVIDRDLEARKHLWRGLERMNRRERVAFLRSQCGTVQGPGGVGVEVTEAPTTVGEAYMDLCLLAVGFGRDLYGVCADLESWLRRRT